MTLDELKDSTYPPGHQMHTPFDASVLELIGRVEEVVAEMRQPRLGTASQVSKEVIFSLDHWADTLEGN